MKLFEVFGEIKIKDGKSLAKLKEVDDSAKSITGKLKNMAGKVGKAAAVFGTLGVAAGGALFGMAKQAGDALDRVDKLSQKMGMSAETFQEWDYITSQFGTSMETVKTGMKTFGQRIDDLATGTGAGADAMQRLGFLFEDVKDMSPEEQFETTIKRLQEMENETERNALASELFGRAGQELIPILNAEGDTIDDLKGKAHELGLVQSDEAVKAGALFTDTLDTTTRMLKGMATEIGVQLLPIVNKFLGWVQDNMPKIKKFFDVAFNDVIIPVVKTLWTVFDTLILPILKTVFGWLSDNMPAIQKTFTTVFGTAYDVVKAVYDVFKNNILPVFQSVYDFAKDKFGFIGDVISGAFGLIGDVVKTTFGFISDLIGGFKKAYDWAKDFLNINKKVKQAEPPKQATSTGWGGMNTIDGYRADGGEVEAGKSYVVGERQPELFTPSENGYISPSVAGGISVNTMIVREEADIDKIARKLFNLQRDTNRGYAI